jgi:hypothetical protein
MTAVARELTRALAPEQLRPWGLTVMALRERQGSDGSHHKHKTAGEYQETAGDELEE